MVPWHTPSLDRSNPKLSAPIRNFRFFLASQTSLERRNYTLVAISRKKAHLRSRPDFGLWTLDFGLWTSLRPQTEELALRELVKWHFEDVSSAGVSGRTDEGVGPVIGAEHVILLHCVCSLVRQPG